MPSVVHGNSKPLFVVIVVGIDSVDGRLFKRMFDSLALRARFASARSVLSESAAMST